MTGIKGLGKSNVEVAITSIRDAIKNYDNPHSPEYKTLRNIPKEELLELDAKLESLRIRGVRNIGFASDLSVVEQVRTLREKAEKIEVALNHNVKPEEAEKQAGIYADDRDDAVAVPKLLGRLLELYVLGVVTEAVLASPNTPALRQQLEKVVKKAEEKLAAKEETAKKPEPTQKKPEEKHEEEILAGTPLVAAAAVAALVPAPEQQAQLVTEEEPEEKEEGPKPIAATAAPETGMAAKNKEADPFLPAMAPRMGNHKMLDTELGVVPASVQAAEPHPQTPVKKVPHHEMPSPKFDTGTE